MKLELGPAVARAPERPPAASGEPAPGQLTPGDPAPAAPAPGSRPGTDWNERYRKLLVVIPWVLLGVPTLASQLSPQPLSDRMMTLGLILLAAAWVYLNHTRASARCRPPAAMLLYFCGLLALFVALMSRDLVFLVFTITGFFHAYLLRPWQLGVAGVFATSVILNTMTMGFPGVDPTEIGTYAGVILIQSAAIGLGILVNEKVAEQQRRREEMLARLETALAENAGLHAQLLTQAREAGVHDERQRMAREIHDTIAQGLTGIIIQVQAAQKVWHAPEQARPYLDRALGLARESLTEARRSLQALAPGELAEARLPEALSDLATRWAEANQVELRVDVTGDQVPLSPAIEVTLFRVAQEALTNVAKHAGAGRVGLTLSYLSDVVLLDVRDDGRGIAAAPGEGFGLNSMRQRIRGVGGSMEVESGPGEGTAISASVPAIIAATS